MKCRIAIVVLAATCLAASPGWGQSEDDEKQDLRRLITALQETLKEAQNDGKSDSRVTELGGRPRPMGMPAEPVMVVRIYDLSDLFAMAPPYPATITPDLGQPDRPLFVPSPSETFTGGGMGGFGGGMGGMGGGFFSVEKEAGKLPEPSRRVLHQLHAGTVPSVRTSIDQLIEAITATIEPESWDDVGGPGSIATLGNALLISAEEHVHEQIDKLLNSFRERWGTLRTVSARAYWLWLDDAELEPLLAVADDPNAKSEDKIEAFGLVDEAAWQLLMERLARDDQHPAGYRAALTCYNGQTVHAVSGGQSLAVTGVEPVVVEGDELLAIDDDEGVPASRVAYRPDLSVIQEGAALQITPITSVSGKFVVVDVHSRVAYLRDGGQGGWQAGQVGSHRSTPSPQQLAAAIDRPQLCTHRFSTTMRVPVDRTMLVGGMTDANGPKPAGPSLYLFLKVSVQELRDEVTRRTPDAEAKSDTAPKPKLPSKPKEKPRDKPKKKSKQEGRAGQPEK